jgi:cytoskeletal protein RodZ
MIIFVGGDVGKVRLRHGVGKFGDKFRKERERQGIKLEDVSNSTKIGSRMLRAIEEEHFDQLPGGVFNKGFIRAYAKHLGLDEEETITGYVAALNQFNSQPLGQEKLAAPPPATERSPASSSNQSSSDQRGSVQPKPVPPAERRQAGERRSDPRRRSSDSRASDPQDIELPGLQLPKAEHVRPRRRMAVHSDLDSSRWRLPALVVLLIVAGAFWWSHSRNARANGANPAPASISSSSTAPAPTLVTGGPASGNDAAGTAAASSRISSSVHPAAKAAAHPGSTTAGSTTAGSTTAGSPSTSSPSSVAASGAHASGAKEEAKQAEADPSSASPTRPVANLTLVIRASENSWIAVTADGQPVVHETLIAPAHTSVRAAKEIVVRAGNAAGVTFALNGQEFPSQGAEGEVKTLIFDSTGLRPAPVPATTPAPTPTAPPADPTR